MDAPSPNPTPQEQHPLRLTKTTGEKWFDAIRFITGEGIILLLTAAMAYVTQYGKEAYGPKGEVKNYLRQFDRYLTKKLEPMAGKGGVHERIAGAIVGTTILMHGGNAFVPVKKELQNRKETIVTYFNKRFGKPGEVEEGALRVRAQEKETWGDVIKGRVGAWMLVFTSFMGADLIAGKNEATGKYKFDEYNEKFGKWVAGLTKKGKEAIAKIPQGQVLSKELEGTKTFRFGKILALDIYATTAALFVWNAISKISAKLRKEKQLETQVLEQTHSLPVQEAPPQEPATSFRDRAGDRPADFRTLVSKEPVPAGVAMQ